MHYFQPNCTLPPEGTNYVESPPIRGTLQILWSSLSVLILCTWTLQHLNVPPQTTARGFWQKLRRTATRLYTKVGWMLFNVLAPEWIFTKACLDWISVHQLKVDITKQADADGVPWTNAHTHFANMGGFGISFQDSGGQSCRSDVNVESTVTNSSQGESPPLKTVNHLNNTDLESSEWKAWAQAIDRVKRYVNAEDVLRNVNRIFTRSIPRTEGLQIDSHNSELILDISKSQDVKKHLRSYGLLEDECTNLLLLTANLWILDAAQLLEARKLGIIRSLPHLKEDDLEDRSNNNIFIRLLALGQTIWFILQFLVRFLYGQPNTQLEVMVVAFSVCSIITYFFLIDRPKEVDYTIVLKADRFPNTGFDMLKIANEGPSYWSRSARRSIWISNIQMHHLKPIVGRTDSQEISSVIVCAIMLVFGAIHCVAWNFDFPTNIEQIMWRASSLASVLAPLLAFVVCRTGSNYVLNDTGQSPFFHAMMVMAVILGVFVFPMLLIGARLFILVEVFRTLVFQPSGAFETTWLSDLPHFG